MKIHQIHVGSLHCLQIIDTLKEVIHEFVWFISLRVDLSGWGGSEVDDFFIMELVILIYNHVGVFIKDQGWMKRPLVLSRSSSPNGVPVLAR